MQHATFTPISTASASAARRGHIGGLDGLRAIAVGLVLVYHLFPGSLPGGFLGVDVFFVISGFLITTLLLRERDATGRVDLLDFWRRRARRLVPAMLLVVLTAGALAALAGGDVLVGLGRQVAGALTFSYNWVSILFDASYFDQTSPDLLRNFWSLAVEEQFYILWPPVFLALAWLGGRRVVGAASAVFAAASIMRMLALAPEAGADATRVYFGTDTHAFGIALGCALASLLPSAQVGRRSGAVFAAVGGAGVAALLALSAIVDDFSGETYPWGLLAASVSAAAVIAAGALAPGFGRMLDTRLLRWIGHRSYGIYLWHWPMIVLARQLLDGAAPPPVIGVGVLLATLGVAHWSYVWVEQPIRRHGFRAVARHARAAWVGASRRRWRALALTAYGLIAAVVLGIGIGQAPGESDAARIISQGQEQLDATTNAPSPPSVPEPTRDADELDIAPDGADVTAIGDSVMLASVPALQEQLPGIEIDASVSRDFEAGLDIAERLQAEGALRDYVVLGLATNAKVSDAALDRLRLLAADHRLVLVTAYGDRPWIPPANDALARFAAAHRDRAVIADWSGAAARSEGVLAPDLIHPEPAGATIYAAVVVECLETQIMLERGLKPHRPVIAEPESSTPASESADLREP